MADMKGKGNDVDAFVAKIEPGKRSLVEALRKFVKKQAPALKEAIKWGNVTWIGNDNVAWIIVYRDHVDFGFFNGALLKDPKGLLDGTGKKLRHVKVFTKADIREGDLAALVKQALTLDAKSG
jgi:hypothetical protein